MLPQLFFPMTYNVKMFPMMAKYHLERWRKVDYLHLTENDWRNFTSPIFISQTEADEWMRSATGQVHDLAWDRRRGTKSDLPTDQSTRPKDRRCDCLQNPPSRKMPTVRGLSSPESYVASMNRVVSSRAPPSSGGLFGSTPTCFGPSSQTTGGGLFGTRVLGSAGQPLNLIDGDCSK